MDRDAIEKLISRRYADAHGAMPTVSFTHFHAHGSGTAIGAVLGYRRADLGKLFLEAYLDRPVEDMLGAALGRSFRRHDIVEIGNLAASNAPAMIALWAQASNDLADEAEIAVAVLTAPLRSMFRRLGITLHEIAPARIERLGAEGAQWGRYYASDPVVCAGFIADGQDRLSRLVARRERRRCA